MTYEEAENLTVGDLFRLRESNLSRAILILSLPTVYGRNKIVMFRVFWHNKIDKFYISDTTAEAYEKIS